MKHIVWLLLATLLLGACGQTEEQKRYLSRQERLQRIKADSAALKIAVMPTLDCLPLYVAQMYNLYDSLGADVRLRLFTAQMDCDTALVGGSVEGGVTDLVRCQRLMDQGTPLEYVTSTNAYWQLISNRKARINNVKQLYDKMVAMTRYSATALLADYATDSVKLQRERVFKVQINDVNVRLDMLMNNEMDAMFLTEPQAAVGREMKNKVLMDSRSQGLNLGVIVFRKRDLENNDRRKQLDAFVKAYNMACDSINKNGILRYGELISKYTGVKIDYLRSLEGKLTFNHVAKPRQADIARANRWLKEQ